MCSSVTGNQFFNHNDMPAKIIKKIELAAARFVYGRYVNDIGDILKLNWLPVE